MIEFIIPTYNRPNQLMGVISSIFSQASPNWKIHVVADAVYDGYQKVKDYFNGDDRIRFTELNGPHKDWGHTPRQFGLDNASEEWVVMSSDDNYYTPNFVDTFLSVVDGHINFIYCDMLHNHNTRHTAPYRYFDTKPQIDYIDIGNFATRTYMAKQISFNKGSYGADGEFVEKYTQTFCKEPHNIRKIKQALYIHN